MPPAPLRVIPAVVGADELDGADSVVPALVDEMVPKVAGEDVPPQPESIKITTTKTNAVTMSEILPLNFIIIRLPFYPFRFFILIHLTFDCGLSYARIKIKHF